MSRQCIVIIIHGILKEMLNTLGGLRCKIKPSAAFQVLAMRELELGPDHLEVAASLNNLAVLLKTMNCNEEAESLFARSISIKEHTLGPNHPQVNCS